VLFNLLALGLVACSSTPAPWSRPDTSPWGERRSADSAAVPADTVVTQPPVLEPEPVAAPPMAEPPMAEPPPAYEPEPMAAPAEVPEPMGYKAQSVVSDINNEQRILALPGNYFAVQAYAAATLESVEKFKADHGLDDMIAVETDRNGKSIYVLVETFDTRGAAKAAADKVHSATGSAPWVRSVAGLQKVVKQ